MDMLLFKELLINLYFQADIWKFRAILTTSNMKKRLRKAVRMPFSQLFVRACFSQWGTRCRGGGGWLPKHCSAWCYSRQSCQSTRADKTGSPLVSPKQLRVSWAIDRCLLKSKILSWGLIYWSATKIVCKQLYRKLIILSLLLSLYCLMSLSSLSKELLPLERNQLQALWLLLTRQEMNQG